MLIRKSVLEIRDGKKYHIEFKHGEVKAPLKILVNQKILNSNNFLPSKENFRQ